MHNGKAKKREILEDILLANIQITGKRHNPHTFMYFLQGGEFKYF